MFKITTLAVLLIILYPSVGISQLEEPLEVPFSFVYGGQPSSGFLSGWKRKEHILPKPDKYREHRKVTYTDPKTELLITVESIIYQDFSAVEWLLYFKNTGSSDTPIIEKIQALDQTLDTNADEKCVIHYSNGALCSFDDFAPMKHNLTSKVPLELQPGGGRSSSEVLPFFNVELENSGTIYAIGWTGEWAAGFERNEQGRVHLQAGMDRTHLKLHPDEEIRTPRILQLNWKQNRIKAHNTFKRLILKYHFPKQNGKAMKMPAMLFGAWGAESIDKHLEQINKIEISNLPFEYYWIDAQWYGSGKDWYKNVGNWQHCKDLYPQGLKPIGDLLHKTNRKFLLWFEPERVAKDTPWYNDHKEWLIELSPEKETHRTYLSFIDKNDPSWRYWASRCNQFAEGDALFNLGDSKARQFLTDFISSKITEYGVDCYRQDFNFAPLDFWRKADAPDRQGITEIRYIEGLYAFWDELLRRHPNLIIDNCASGGKRIDLETISRSMTLWRSDSGYADYTEAQCHTYGLLFWLPLHGAGQPNRGSWENNYAWRSQMTPAIVSAINLDGDLSTVKKNMAQYLKIHKYFYGDYYPLTEYSQAEDTWMAYQLDLPDSNEGLVVVLKRPKSSGVKAVLPLFGLQDDSSYKLTNLDTDQSRIMTGKELKTQGLTVELLNKPDSGLFEYRIQPAKTD